MEIKDYLIKLCKHVGLLEEQFSVEIEEGDELIKAKLILPDEESGLIIGYHGETLQAIQRVVRVSFYEQLAGKIFKLNVNDYREERQEQLLQKLSEVVGRVRETGEPYTFSYLTSHDRYLIHTTLAEEAGYGDVTSQSSGQGKHRYLTIELNEA